MGEATQAFIAPPDPAEYRFVRALREAESAGVIIRLTKQHNVVAAHQNRFLAPFLTHATLWEVFPPMLLCRTDDETRWLYIVGADHENDDIRTLVKALAEQIEAAIPAPDAWEVPPANRHEIAETYPGHKALVILPVSMAQLTQQEKESEGASKQAT